MQISQPTFDFLFLVLMIIAIVGALWIPLTWLLLSIFTPKSLLEKYFKEPHFTLTETILMAQFPGFLMRTAIFGWALLLPSLDRVRKIVGLRNYMPRWYIISLNILTIGTMTILFLFLSLMSFLLVFKPEI